VWVEKSGSNLKHNEAFSFQVATTDQAETDRYWNAIVGNGGDESACGSGSCVN
jgi:2-polyprenyl-6-hydroxyphenyl methylase/3-demethylubiquinone-9 3-methyltransferase